MAREPWESDRWNEKWSAEKKMKKNTNWLKVVHKKKKTPGKTREIIQSQECGTDTPGWGLNWYSALLTVLEKNIYQLSK